MPRVAHVTYMRTDAVGIIRKVEQQARAAAAAGLDDLDFFVLQTRRSGTGGNLNFVKITPRVVPLDYYERMFACYRIIDRSVDLAPYDYVILRYPSADASGIEFVKRYRVITEHHSDELSEFRATGAADLPLARRALGKARYLLEKTYGDRLLAHCRGVIAVTDEIRELELGRVGRALPSATIPNGVDVSEISQTGFRPFDGRRLDLVMVASNTASTWHGLDRLVRSLAAYRGAVKAHLHVIGAIDPVTRSRFESLYSAIEFHGPRTGDDLDELMLDKTLAVSTLALYRKRMQEACSLKTREYTARGIPFILAYRDPDLAPAETQGFCHTFANDESLIDIEEVIELAVEVSRRGRRESLSNTMRAFARDHMDWKAKMPRYAELISELK